MYNLFKGHTVPSSFLFIRIVTTEPIVMSRNCFGDTSISLMIHVFILFCF